MDKPGAAGSVMTRPNEGADTAVSAGVAPLSVPPDVPTVTAMSAAPSHFSVDLLSLSREPSRLNRLVTFGKITMPLPIAETDTSILLGLYCSVN